MAKNKKVASDKPKKVRVPFAARMKARYGEAKRLGSTLVHRPREFPKEMLELMRLGFRDLWKLRGGGLYACGFIITWIWFEIRMLIDDFSSFTGFGDFLSGQLLQFIIRFGIDSLINTVRALMWPAYIAQWSPPYGPVALGLAFVLFPMTLKKPLEKWLFGDVEETEQPSS